jgi:hypothetical protein
MSLPITSIVQNAGGSWTFSWAAVLPAAVYRVVLFGKQLTSTTATTYTYAGPGFPIYPPPLEIVSGTQLALSEQFSPYIYLQWYGVSCSNYLVQQYSGSVWATVQSIKEVGQWIYTYASPVLADTVTYQYRVIAQDSLGNQSSPRQWVQLMVCPPRSPDGTVTVSYSNPLLTIGPLN